MFYKSNISLPEKKKNPKTGSGYTFMTKNILEFHIMHEMPIALNICRLDDGDLTIQNVSAHKRARSAKGTRIFRHWSSNKVHQKFWEVKSKRFLIAFAKESPLVVKVEKQLLSM